MKMTHLWRGDEDPGRWADCPLPFEASGASGISPSPLDNTSLLGQPPSAESSGGSIPPRQPTTPGNAGGCRRGERRLFSVVPGTLGHASSDALTEPKPPHRAPTAYPDPYHSSGPCSGAKAGAPRPGTQGERGPGWTVVVCKVLRRLEICVLHQVPAPGWHCGTFHAGTPSGPKSVLCVRYCRTYEWGWSVSNLSCIVCTPRPFFLPPLHPHGRSGGRGTSDHTSFRRPPGMMAMGRAGRAHTAPRTASVACLHKKVGLSL